MSLAGKKAVVFGGTSGIGLAACHKLVVAGAEVVAASRDPEKAGRGEIPAGVRLVKCDVRDEEGLAGGGIHRDLPVGVQRQASRTSPTVAVARPTTVSAAP